MEVILLQRVEKLGLMGDVVKVKTGFARNFLLPQKKALRATSENIAAFESRRKDYEATNLKKREEAEAIGAKLEGQSIIILRQASDSDHLYGSVSTRDIANALIELGFQVDKTQILRDRPIKTVGLHILRVSLHPEVTVEITVNVARSAEEAELQARGERVGQDEDDDLAVDADAFFEPGATPEEAELAEAGGHDDAESTASDPSDSAADQDRVSPGAS